MAAKLKAITRRDEAEKLLSLVTDGNGTVMREIVDGVTETIVMTKGGAPICSIGKNYRYMFDCFVQQHGNNDGLFPGFSQTAERH